MDKKDSTEKLYQALGELISKYKMPGSTGLSTYAYGADPIDDFTKTKSFTIEEIQKVIATLPQAGGYIQVEDLITELNKQ